MIVNIIPILIFAVLCTVTAWRMWQPQQGRRLGAYVMLLYGLIAIAGMGCALRFFPAFSAPEILPLLHIYLMILLLTLPIYRFSEGTIRVIDFSSRRVFLGFAYGIAVVTVVGYLAYIPDAFANASDAFRFDSFKETYSDQRVDGSLKTGLSMANIPLVIANSFSEVVPFLLACLLGFKRHLLLKYLLLTSILCSLLMVTGSAGRNGLVFFCLVIVGTIMLFWNLLSTQTRRRFLMGSAALVIFLFVIVVRITLSRFGTREDMTPMDSVLIYAGQPLLNFGEFIYNARMTCNGDMNFPLFRAMLGLDYSASLDIRTQVWEMPLGVPLGVFYTIFGDLILDFGSMITTVLVLALAFFIMCNAGHSGKNTQVHRLFLVYVLFLIVSKGIFYYPYKTITGNLQVLCMIAIYLFFRFTAKETSQHNDLEGVP